MRTGKAVADTNVVLTQKTEGLRRIEVQAVVVPGGVLEVAKALAQILTAEFRTRSRLSRSRVVDARRGSDRTTNQAARRALNQIIDITIPKDHEEGGTYVISGHGRLCDEADVVEYRDMLTIVRDRVKARAQRPTLDYDARYGDAASLLTALR